MVWQCALRISHLQKLKDGCTSLSKGSGQDVNESVIVRELSAGRMVKEAAINMKGLKLCRRRASSMTMSLDGLVSVVMH